MLIRFTGPDALAVAVAARTLPLVEDTVTHVRRPARSLPEARRISSIDPELVVLLSDARVLIEMVTEQSLPLDCDLLAAAKAIQSPPVPADVRDIIIDQVEKSS